MQQNIGHNKHFTESVMMKALENIIKLLTLTYVKCYISKCI